MSVMLRSHLAKLLRTCNTNIFTAKGICFTRPVLGWKNFNLDDELTLDVKRAIEQKWGERVYGESCPAEKLSSNKHQQDGTRKYILSMFPYPSGRLHLGHLRVYTLSDVIARFHRLRGSQVIHPMGWDAFGLPAENAARDHGVRPEEWTIQNIRFMREQLIRMGCYFDWEREFATCDPSYYKWTQWIFLKLWEHGLAYRKRAFVFWDPVDKTVLAEEQVDKNMRSWRSGAKVERKLLKQWFVKTTLFGEQLAAGLNSGELDHGWRDIVKMQKHWIGQIHGFATDCKVVTNDSALLKSQSDPTGDLLKLWFSDVEKLKNARLVILDSRHFLVGMEDCVEKSYSNGIKKFKFSVMNPSNGMLLPVYSGPVDILPKVPESSDCRTDELFDEETFGDLSANEAFLQEILTINKKEGELQHTLESKGFQYYPSSLKLRDWLVSRQRYWGTPIPARNCSNCGHSFPVSTTELPFNNESHANHKCSHCGNKLEPETDTLDTFFDSSWYFLRFLDPMNQNAVFDPSMIQDHLPVDLYIGGKEHATLHLYYARFMSHFFHRVGMIPVKEPFKRLVPIGMVMGETYTTKPGGKYVSANDVEQRDKGLVTKSDGEAIIKKWEKMSKSKFNGTDPEDVIAKYGIDTTRLLIMAEVVPTSNRLWPTDHLWGFVKFQLRIWLTMREFENAKDFGEARTQNEESWLKSEDELFETRNYFLKGITYNYEETNQVSVCISRLQSMLAALRKLPQTEWKDSLQFERALGAFIICLYPIMPAFSAQMWQTFRAVATFTENEFDLDHEVWKQSWPDVDMRYCLDLICNVDHEEACIVKVVRPLLDGMDEETAVTLAFDQPQIRELVSKEAAKISYTLRPGYQAILDIRTPNPKKAKKKKAPKEKQKTDNEDEAPSNDDASESVRQSKA